MTVIIGGPIVMGTNNDIHTLGAVRKLTCGLKYVVSLTCTVAVASHISFPAIRPQPGANAGYVMLEKTSEMSNV